MNANRQYTIHAHINNYIIISDVLYGEKVLNNNAFQCVPTEPASPERTIQRITTKCDTGKAHNKNTSQYFLLEPKLVPDDGINNAEMRRTVAKGF
jgi:hypothetical protein